MLCAICGVKESKYTCPKCASRYCSLACFKSEKHGGMDEKAALAKLNEETTKGKDEDPKDAEDMGHIETQDAMLNELVKNDVFQEYISSPVLQFHILTVLEILNDVSLTNEYSKDGRLEIASRKLNNLRSGGAEENEYVEEFITFLLDWMEEYEREKNT